MLVVGPDENQEGCYYVRKDGNNTYSLVRRYSKEKFQQHKKGDGKSDAFEPEYTSKNPTDFVNKVENLKKSFLGETELSDVEKYEKVPLNFKETEAKFAAYDNEALLHTAKDIQDVIKAGESFVKEGLPYPKLGYYTDELHVILAEIRKRRDKGIMVEDGEGGDAGFIAPADPIAVGTDYQTQNNTDDFARFYTYGNLLARPYSKHWKKK